MTQGSPNVAHATRQGVTLGQKRSKGWAKFKYKYKHKTIQKYKMKQRIPRYWCSILVEVELGIGYLVTLGGEIWSTNTQVIKFGKLIRSDIGDICAANLRLVLTTQL